jgi:hypothetical protein
MGKKIMQDGNVGKANSYQSELCFFCGSINTVSLNYLRLKFVDFRRNLAYLSRGQWLIFFAPLAAVLA